MKTGFRILLTLLVGGHFAALTVQAKPVVEEIADPSLPDIAAVHFVSGQGPVILYNPILCKQAGRALCEFYRYHEYGHIALRHHERTEISRQEKEQEADLWAAQHAPGPVVLAAWHYFLSGGGATPVHGDGPTRAARLMDRRKQANASLEFEYRPRKLASQSFSALAL